ncbi:hypothetical protein UK82_03970 [Frankia sp. ACN1ag]|nr:hypothetical protein [Frankia sp. ACN1ag]KQC39791.1 hypothetical protein UK82_03970 [Frankia sp. ACN1ag]
MRRTFYGCLTCRGDVLFELIDALLCADGPVCSLVGQALAAEHRRGRCTPSTTRQHGGIEADPAAQGAGWAVVAARG